MDILQILFKRAAPSRPDTLHPGVPQRLILAGATTLGVLRGRLWITVEADPRDWFVAAGETLSLPPGRRIVIECDSAEPARLHWTASAAAISGVCAGAVASR